jgi:hypothetical protein
MCGLFTKYKYKHNEAYNALKKIIQRELNRQKIAYKLDHSMPCSKI